MTVITQYQMGIPTHRKKQRGHTTPRAPIISLDQPGRLRVANLLALFACAHTTFYDRLAKNLYPKPDGYDGKHPWWRTSTIKAFLDV
jgi:hypothetical protein